MKDDIRGQYDRNRDIARQPFRSACYAPFTSLYFNPTGDVTPCCQTQKSDFVLGNVAVEPLGAIWNGEKIRQLRESLAGYQFPKACGFCDWQVRSGNMEGVFATVFDVFTIYDSPIEWPIAMEFSMSNACNFECIMCDGVNSSRIRKRREKRPPLPRPYDERFLDDLDEYLPHLRWARFYGGEPFLSSENYRVWSGLGKRKDWDQVAVQITTNGSIYHQKVEEVLDSLAVDVVVSLDAATRESLERVRVNANYDRIMENIARFRKYAYRKGTDLGFSYCLMPQTWTEFGDVLLFAEDQGSEVFVNTVTDPKHCSLYSLPNDELSTIVEKLEEQGKNLVGKLKINRKVWNKSVAGLKSYLLSRGPEKLADED